MTDLAGFLLARIAEDEEAAKAATPGPWRWVDPGGPVKQALVGDGDQMIVPSRTPDVYPSVYDAEHIARWDPARVLVECEAKRRIVERAVDTQRHAARSWDDEYAGEAVGLAVALTYLALPYASHPDYDPDWAVSWKVKR